MNKKIVCYILSCFVVVISNARDQQPYFNFKTAETATWNVPNAPDIPTVPGGIAFKTKEGIYLGGVGVSGAAAQVDAKCAEEGVRRAGLF